MSDMTTALIKWQNTLPGGNDLNTRMRDALAIALGVSANSDLQTMLSQYLPTLYANGGAPPSAPAGYDIIFSTGDSNKKHGASFDGALDTGDTNLKQLGYTSPNTDAVIAAVDPLDAATDGVDTGNIGHDVHFAKDYYMANGLRLGARQVLIVQTSKGGSYAGVDNFAHWGALTGTAGTPTTSSGSLLDIASGRRTTALALTGTNTVVACLELEGSNAYSAYGNASQTTLMHKYRWQLERKYQFIRNLLGPTVPIVISRATKDAINAAGGVYSTNGVRVDRIIKSMERKFTYFGVANSQSPTELGGDGVSGDVHFSAADQRTLSGRYYTAFVAAKANTTRGVVTWEPDDVMLSADGYPAGFTLANSNLDLSGDANSAWKTHRISAPVRSGKVYCEVKIQAVNNASNMGMLGFCNADRASSTWVGDSAIADDGPAKMGASQWGGSPTNSVLGYTKDWTGTLSWVVNDIIMFAVDYTAGKAWIGKNGTWSNSGDPAAGTGQWLSGIVDPIYLAASIYTGTNNTYRLQPSSASFSYSAPSGFSAWGA